MRAHRVLIVEDSPTDRFLLADTLARDPFARYEIVEAERLAAGLERLAAGGIDLVLLDLGLPDSTGEATFRAVQSVADGIPVVVCTGQDDAALGLKLVRDGADDFLTKGESAESASRAVRHGIERAAVRQRLRERDQELVRSEERYRSVTDTVRDGIFAVDRDSVIRFVNEAGARLVGYKVGDLVGQDVGLVAPPETRARIGAFIAGGQPTTERALVELQAICRDGTRCWLELSVGELPFSGGPSQVIAVARDISERKRMEAEAERQRENLLRIDKMVALGTILAGVAHEIGNPTHSIMLCASILDDNWRDVQALLDRATAADAGLADVLPSGLRTEVPGMIADIRSGAERIKAIVAALRDYARDDGALTVGAVDLNAVVRSALVLPASRLREATRAFSVHYADGLPRARGNARRLEQVVFGLVMNACQALRSTTQAIRVETAHDPQGWVTVVVEDEGRGIAAEDLARITDPFFTTHRAEGRTGLGLAIAHRVVDEMGGSLTFESVVDRGTVARLSLPALTAEHDESRHARVARPAGDPRRR